MRTWKLKSWRSRQTRDKESSKMKSLGLESDDSSSFSPFAFRFSLFLLILNFHAQAQVYTSSNAHSHNDYEQPSPFWNAWKHQFGSIEADIFLADGQLIVAHDKLQVQQMRTLDSLYLLPLQQCINRNNGYVYADTAKKLQLMIDIKSEAIATLKKLTEKLAVFPSLINCTSLQIVISGNRPPAAEFTSWPSYIYFDGDLSKQYSPAELLRIPMLSANLAKFTSWKGEGAISIKEETVIRAMIDSAHLNGKKTRFWNIPDNTAGWKQLIKWGVDYINTDHIEKLGAFIVLALKPGQ
jgi:alkaline phosphatase